MQYVRNPRTWYAQSLLCESKVCSLRTNRADCLRHAGIIGGFSDPTGSRQGTQGRCCRPGRLSLQIFKKKRASPKEMTVSYDVLETVDTMNCEIIETVMIILLPVIGPRLLCAVMCSQKVKPKIFPKNKKALPKTVQ